MASIIKGNINLDKIPKEKIFMGKKGKYLPITVTINDELDQFNNAGSVCVEQTKEEREAKAPKVYLSNVKIVWTNGTNVEKTPYEGGQQAPQANVTPQATDLPF
jgi:hypothetical protein